MNTFPEGLSAQDVFLTRVIDAPRELVWKAFTEAERLAQWWGPKGCTTRVLKLDFRPSGLFHYVITTPDGGEMWGKFVYHEIVPEESMTFVLSFADEDANTVRAPFSATWPLEILSQTTFTAQEGKTLLTMAAAPFNATDEESQSFSEGRASLQEGTEESLDQLAAYLTTAS